jgi:predicted hydrolase (HD superfamily)
LVRPNRIADLEASSVKKKLKDKAFARSVSREDIYQGIAEMQVNMDEHIQFVIAALKQVSSELGV